MCALLTHLYYVAHARTHARTHNVALHEMLNIPNMFVFVHSKQKYFLTPYRTQLKYYSHMRAPVCVRACAQSSACLHARSSVSSHIIANERTRACTNFSSTTTTATLSSSIIIFFFSHVSACTSLMCRALERAHVRARVRACVCATRAILHDINISTCLSCTRVRTRSLFTKFSNSTPSSANIYKLVSCIA